MIFVLLFLFNGSVSAQAGQVCEWAVRELSPHVNGDYEAGHSGYPGGYWAANVRVPLVSALRNPVLTQPLSRTEVTREKNTFSLISRLQGTISLLDLDSTKFETAAQAFASVRVSPPMSLAGYLKAVWRRLAREKVPDEFTRSGILLEIIYQVEDPGLLQAFHTRLFIELREGAPEAFEALIGLARSTPLEDEVAIPPGYQSRVERLERKLDELLRRLGG